MFDAITVKSFDWSYGGYKRIWTWEILKILDYLELIGKNFLIYLDVIVAVDCVLYYIASLIIKKQTNFGRLLCIFTMVVVPILICFLILSPLLSLIWAEVAMLIILICAIIQYLFYMNVWIVRIR